ncbi:MAG: amino acid ABC transporter substrate-binding protein [Bacillota bacterium]|nr:amino acid ABC transporter substrate-binding protein [Bacillota bacterium]
MKRKLALILMLCFTLGILLIGCGSSEPQNNDQNPNPAQTDTSWQDIQDKGSFIMGLDDAFPPMGFRDADTNDIVGFDVDMAKEAAKRLGVEVEFQPIIWETKVQDLNGGNIDMIWNGLTITPERQQAMDFTAPYMEDNQIIVVTPDSPIATKADLSDKQIGIQAESSAKDAIRADEATYELVKDNLREFESNDLALLDLRGGGVDAVVVDEVVGRYYIINHPNDYKVLEEDFGVEEFGVGLRKGDQAFLTELQKALDEMKEDGTAAAISQKWFGENITK